jgi:hypothetical protein
MRVSTQRFWLPKAGNSADEYEDAFWPPEPITEWEGTRFRCAVADGATETSFSAAWAGMLVQEYCEQSSLNRFMKALPHLQRDWLHEVTARPLPWYAEEKVRSGAFASLLGLTLFERAAAKQTHVAVWDAVAIGDSCLFHFQADRLLAAFPLTHSDQFNSRPYLLGTVGQSLELLYDHITVLRGKCHPGDTFYLMTDALACWFLRHQEEDTATFDYLSDIRDQHLFEEFVREQRVQRDCENRPYLRNDDVTLFRVEVY